MFWAPCGSGVGGVDGWGWGVVGGCPPHICTCTRTHAHACTHTHMHACTCMHAHAHMLNMIISCKWLPPLGESLGIPYDVIHACACVHLHACACVCMCVWGTLSPPPTPIHPPPHPPRMGTPRITQNSIALELIEIFQFRLKI